jgi:hypothetical protein
MICRSGSVIVAVMQTRVIQMRLSLLAIVSALILSGCGSDGEQAAGTSEPRDDTALTAETDFDARLRAATTIQNVDEQDEALAALASSAAESGNTDFAKKAIQSMRNTNASDSAARESVIKLGKLGEIEAASKLAENIHSTTIEDEARAALAKIAAAAGDAVAVKKEIDKMRNVGAGDLAARDSAVELARVGKAKVAVEVAEKISDKSIQDDALKQIAAGQ